MTKNDKNKPKQFMRLEKVRELIGVSQSTLDLWTSEVKFIPKIKIGNRISAYVEEDFIKWQQKCIKESQNVNSNEQKLDKK